MTETQILQWIKDNVSPFLITAITEHKKKNPQLLYTEDWLAAICMRETGLKIAKRLGQGFKVPEIWAEMKGDWSQRPGETEKQYHGFGLPQIDIASFPSFVKSGDWKDPKKSWYFSINVLEGKRKWINTKCPDVKGEFLERAITAAYNCGEGNVVKLLKAGRPVDTWTHEHNYSSEVFRFRKIYKSLTVPDKV
jgi:hypothetical protein